MSCLTHPGPAAPCTSPPRPGCRTNPRPAAHLMRRRRPCLERTSKLRAICASRTNRAVRRTRTDCRTDATTAHRCPAPCYGRGLTWLHPRDARRSNPSPVRRAAPLPDRAPAPSGAIRHRQVTAASCATVATVSKRVRRRCDGPSVTRCLGQLSDRAALSRSDAVVKAIVTIQMQVRPQPAADCRRRY